MSEGEEDLFEVESSDGEQDDKSDNESTGMAEDVEMKENEEEIAMDKKVEGINDETKTVQFAEEKKDEPVDFLDEPEEVELVEFAIPLLPKIDPSVELNCLRLPRSVHFAMEPYDEATYDEEQELAELKALGKETAAENIIRWRYRTSMLGEKVINPETGKPEIESNTVLIEDAQGKLTLNIGNESFDIIKTPMDSKSMMYTSTQDQDGNAVMVAQGRFAYELRIRPSNLNARSYKEIELQAKSKNMATSKIKKTENLQDPEKAQDQQLKSKSDGIRAKRGRSQATRKRNINEVDEYGYEAESDPENTTSVKAIKKQVRKKSVPKNFLSSSESGSEDSDSDSLSQKKKKKKIKRTYSSDLSESELSKDDDDEEEKDDEKPTKNVKKAGAVIDSDSD